MTVNTQLFNNYIVLVGMFSILLFIIPLSVSQKTGKWHSCECRFDSWKPCSKCSSLCYGTQIRERSVWTICKTFEDCDLGAGGWEQRVCKKDCNAGHHNGFRCVCLKGHNGECCDQVVTCGKPASISNGQVRGSNYTYSSAIVYSCDQSYNMTGSGRRTCQENGGWSGSSPRCLFAESCGSSPCQNDGTCVNQLGTYTCNCGTGWSGRNCEVDSQPPVYDKCPGSVLLNIATHETNFSWNAPHFHDPHGQPVTISHNYNEPSFIFPWGDHVVSYRAVKPSNGLTTSCTFKVSVRPIPCPTLSPPSDGYAICNGWRKDYGRFCLLGCKSGFALPRSFDSRQWVVCGASGSWTHDNIPTCCDTQYPVSSSKQNPVDCSDMSGPKLHYVSALKRSSFNTFCVNNMALCTPEHVDVICSP